MADDAADPDILDDFFAEIADAERKFASKTSVASSENVENSEKPSAEQTSAESSQAVPAPEPTAEIKEIEPQVADAPGKNDVISVASHDPHSPLPSTVPEAVSQGPEIKFEQVEDDVEIPSILDILDDPMDGTATVNDTGPSETTDIRSEIMQDSLTTPPTHALSIEDLVSPSSIPIQASPASPASDTLFMENLVSPPVQDSRPSPPGRVLSVEDLVSPPVQDSPASPRSHALSIEDVMSPPIKGNPDSPPSHALSIENLVSPPVQESPASPPNHALSIDDLVSPPVQASPASPPGHAPSIEDVVSPPVQASPASPPSHDFSIEDLVSQDIEHHVPPPPLETPRAVFKRPVSPRLIAPAPPAEETVSRPEDHPDAPAKVRKEIRPTLPQPQKCLIARPKRRRPETDAAHLVAILEAICAPGKLLLPDALLMDYLDEAGMEVADMKVPRLMGAAAEHHSASVIQDVFQIYIDGQQEKRKQGKEKDNAATRAEKRERAKAKLGRPPSGSPKPHKKKGIISKDKKKQQTDSDDPDQLLSEGSSSFDHERMASFGPEENGSRLPNPSPVERSQRSGSNPPPSQSESMDIDDTYDKSEVRSVISKDERESERGGGGCGGRKETKREREKEAEKRNILTLDILTPVLREHGYHLGYPPYFVN